MISLLPAGMPMPGSATAKDKCSARQPTLMVTVPLAVNLMALVTRLTSTWRSRLSSAETHSGTGSSTTLSSNSPLSEASCCIIRHRSATNGRTASGARTTSIRPDSIFEKSRTSLIRLSSPWAESWTIFRCRTTSGCSLASSASWVNPITPLSGVLISWLHVSQELALDTVGLFGARGGGGQVAGPFRYRAFQLLTNGALAKQSPRQPHHPAQHQGPTHLSRRRRRRQRLCQIGGMKTGQAAAGSEPHRTIGLRQVSVRIAVVPHQTVGGVIADPPLALEHRHAVIGAQPMPPACIEELRLDDVARQAVVRRKVTQLHLVPLHFHPADSGGRQIAEPQRSIRTDGEREDEVILQPVAYRQQTTPPPLLDV